MKLSPATPDFRETCPSFTLDGPSGRANAVGLAPSETETATIISFGAKIQPTWLGVKWNELMSFGVMTSMVEVYNFKM